MSKYYKNSIEGFAAGKTVMLVGFAITLVLGLGCIVAATENVLFVLLAIVFLVPL